MGTSPRGVEMKVPVATQRQREHGPPSPPQAPETTSGGSPSCATGPPGLTHLPSRRQRPTGQGLPVLFVVVDHVGGGGGGVGRVAGGTTTGGGVAVNEAAVGCVGVVGTRKGEGGGGVGSTAGPGAMSTGFAVGCAVAGVPTEASARVDSGGASG